MKAYETLGMYVFWEGFSILQHILFVHAIPIYVQSLP